MVSSYQPPANLTLFASLQTQTAFQIRAGEFRTGGKGGESGPDQERRRDISPVDKNIDKSFINCSPTEQLKKTTLCRHSALGRTLLPIIVISSLHACHSVKTLIKWTAGAYFIGQLQTGCCRSPPPSWQGGRDSSRQQEDSGWKCQPEARTLLGILPPTRDPVNNILSLLTSHCLVSASQQTSPSVKHLFVFYHNNEGGRAGGQGGHLYLHVLCCKDRTELYSPARCWPHD